MEGRDGTKICPECAEEVKAAAHVCRFCGYRFDPSQPPQAPPQRDVRESLLKPLWFRVLIVLSTLAIAAAAIILIARPPGSRPTARETPPAGGQMTLTQGNRLKSRPSSRPPVPPTRKP